MRGWVFDRDALGSKQRVDIYQTAPARRIVASVNTSITRPDVNRAYAITGVHGWTASFAATPGLDTFCAYGINIGPGTNVLLGCRRAQVTPTYSPVGYLDSTSTSGSTVAMGGWTFDRDNLTSPEPVDIWQQLPTGRVIMRTYTTIPRPDVNRVYGIGGNHGWSASFTLPLNGNYRFCAYAINVGPSRANVLIGCRSLFVYRRPATDTVLAWGRNYDGELADGSTQNSSVPQSVLTLTGVIAITGTNGGAYAVRSDGTVWGWGYNGEGQLGNGSRVDSSTPVQIAGLSSVTSLAGGVYNGYAARTDGTVWAWGDGYGGGLGNGTQTRSLTPVQVSGLINATAVAAGYRNGYALEADGTVWAWGDNTHGELGTPTPSKSLTPIQVPNLTGVTAIVANPFAAYALKTDGTVWAWGDNELGDLGNGTTTSSPTPVQVAGLTGITAIAGSLALRSDGTVWAWGSNRYGEAGNGTLSDNACKCITQAVQVAGLTGITEISGRGPGYALRSDGTVWAWGINVWGEAGNGTFGTTGCQCVPKPVNVVGLTGITAIAGGGGVAYALQGP
jgi:alpha-tubulin suppressor-like RCC1 family protein